MGDDGLTKPTAKRIHWIFYAVFFASLLFSALFLALRRGDGLQDFFYQRGDNLIGDFINNLHYPTHQGGPYFDAIWATFPPLAYTLYYLVNVCFTRANYFLEIVAYLMVTGLSCVLLLYGVQRIFKQFGGAENRPGSALLFTLCVLMSGVSIYTIERGNSVFNVMILMLFPLYLRESPKAWKRELALLLIALAAGMKIYPCLLGLLYLLEKRYKEALRLVVYGLLFFFVPFIWFSGLEGLKQFLYNQQAAHALARDDYLTSIPSVARFLAAEFGWNMQTAQTVGQWVSYAFAAAQLVCVVLTQKLWLRLLLLMSLATLIPGWSAEYMAWYMVIPCALYFCEVPAAPRRVDRAYMLLFGGIFCLLPFGVGLSFHAPVSWGMLICFGCIYALNIIAMVDVSIGYGRGRVIAL